MSISLFVYVLHIYDGADVYNLTHPLGDTWQALWSFPGVLLVITTGGQHEHFVPADWWKAVNLNSVSLHTASLTHNRRRFSPTWAIVSQVEVSGVQNRVQHGLKQQEVTLRREEAHVSTPVTSGGSLKSKETKDKCSVFWFLWQFKAGNKGMRGEAKEAWENSIIF